MNASTPIPSWLTYMQILNFLLTWGTAFYVYWDRKRSAASKRLSGIETRLEKLENPPADERWDKMDRRLMSIEYALKHPSVCTNHSRMEKNDRDIDIKLDAVKAGVDKIDGRLDGINRMVDLLTQNELNGGK